VAATSVTTATRSIRPGRGSPKARNHPVTASSAADSGPQPPTAATASRRNAAAAAAGQGGRTRRIIAEILTCPRRARAAA
jgi:hypothetical protein